MIVAGVGFRHGVAAEEISALVERALGQASLTPDRLSFLATAASRAGETGFLAAARRLGVAPLGLPPETLATAEPRLETRSGRVLARHGVGSVAEAAALSGAGAASRLVVARISNGRATCAIAEGPSP